MTREFDLRRPFLRSDALAAGVPARRLRGPAVVPVFRGVLVDASVPLTPAVRVAAAIVPFGPGAFASHASAARLLGVPIPVLPDEHVTVAAAGQRKERRGIRTHVSTTAETVAVAGLPVSHPRRLFVELAELLPLVELVAVGDHLVRRRLTTLPGLARHVAASRLPGAARARAAIGHVRAGADSVMETRLRMLIVLAGLPEPDVNPLVGDPDGQLRKHDLVYRRSRTVIEYDGRHHIERVEQWERDLDRREQVDGDQWRMVVVIAAGIYRHPERTLHRIRAVLAQRGEPGLPTRIDDGWRAHFPGR